jgi:hypothetical protein
MADPRPSYDALSEALAGLAVAASTIEALADLPDAYALAAGAADFLAEVSYAMNRIADHIDSGRTLRKEITETFRYAGREAYLAGDAVAAVCARYRIT